MNTTKNQTQALRCCVDYCQTNFNVAGQLVSNNFKCNQRHFNSADLWFMQKQMKKVTQP